MLKLVADGINSIDDVSSDESSKVLRKTYLKCVELDANPITRHDQLPVLGPFVLASVSQLAVVVGPAVLSVTERLQEERKSDKLGLLHLPGSDLTERTGVRCQS